MEPGRSVGAYVVEAHAGSGGMAEVYRARHAALGSVHALKVLRPELAASEEIRHRFLAEGRVQAQVHHPHIARVTDLIAETGVAALVLEWLGGGSLEDRLLAAPGQRLSLERVQGLLIPLLDALHVLHEQGIVHRDVKPANLVFRDDGWDGVKLTDFGVARVSEAVTGGRRHTRAGMRMGTPQYMSPEQVRGKVVDPRSDLFSVAVVAWELLTGELPFEGDSDFETMKQIVEAERPSLELACPELPSSIRHSIERALEVDRDARWPSAGRFAEALRGHVGVPDHTVVAVQDATEVGLDEADDVALFDDLSYEPPVSDEVPLVVEPSSDTWDDADEDSFVVVEAAPVSRGLGCWASVFLAMSFVAAVGIALVVFWAPQQARASREATAAAWAELRTYKTNKDANTDDNYLVRAADHADRAVASWASSESLGMRALVYGWRQGWQFRRGVWDPAAHQALRNAVRDAEEEGASAEAAAAAVWLELGSCRFSADVNEREVACARLGAAADRAVRRLGDRPWMAVEVDWVASLGARTLVEDMLEEQGVKPGERFMDQAVKRCARGLDRVAAAPINGRYLWQNCVRLAGWSSNMPLYLRWGDAMVRHGRGQGLDDAELTSSLFTAASPVCERLEIRTKKGRATTWEGQGTGGWGDLCVFLGRAAMGCDVQAFDQRPTRCPTRQWWQAQRVCEPVEAAGVPWDDAVQAVLGSRRERTARCR